MAPVCGASYPFLPPALVLAQRPVRPATGGLPADGCLSLLVTACLGLAPVSWLLLCRPTAQLALEPGSDLLSLRWSPTSAAIAVCFRLTGMAKTPANHFLAVYDLTGACTGCTLSQARRAAAACTTTCLFGCWRQGFAWNSAGRLLAGFFGTALIVLNARDCSVVAAVEVQAVLRGGVPNALYGQLDWMPGHSGDLVVRLDTAAVQTMACFSMATQQLRWESHAPCGTGFAGGAPVWGALGSAAGLSNTGKDLQVILWLPWTCVPRPSGARSGGQVVRTELCIPNTSSAYELLCYSPDGTLLAVAATATDCPLTKADLSVHLLHWRTGQQLQHISITQSMAGLASGASGWLPLRIKHMLQWAASGGALYVGRNVCHEHNSAAQVTAHLTLRLE